MMEGNTANINQLPFRNSLIPKSEPKTPQSLPFSFNRIAQKARIPSVVSGIPSLSRSQRPIFSTQSFHLPENPTLPTSAIGRSPQFSPKSPYSNPHRHPQALSQTKLRSCEPGTPFAFKHEDQDYKESSPAAFKVHTTPFEKPNALGSLSSNVPIYSHPFDVPSSGPARRSVDEAHLSGGNFSPEPDNDHLDVKPVREMSHFLDHDDQHTLSPSNFKSSTSHSALVKIPRDDEFASTSMMMQIKNNASTLETYKKHIGELSRQCESLQELVNAANADKVELNRRNDAVNEASKKAVALSKRKLEEMETMFSSLKLSSAEYGASVEEARALMAELRQGGSDALELMKKVEPLMDSRTGFSAAAREVIEELQEDRQKSQEVADILREKLMVTGGDLAESKKQIKELKDEIFEDKKAAKQLANNFLLISQQLEQMAVSTNNQKQDIHVAFASAAEAEARVLILNEKIIELSQDLSNRIDQLDAARLQRHENESLIRRNEAMLEEKQKENASLKTSICSAEASLSATHKELQALEVETNLQQRNIDETVATQKLAYEAIQNQLTEESRKNERLLTERDSAENRARTLGNEMTDARRRISDRDEKLHESATRLQVLQHLFDEQSVTLKVTRDSCAELNERIALAEKTHSTAMHDIQVDLASRQEREIGHLEKIASLKEELQRNTESADALSSKQDVREADLKASLTRCEQRANTAQRKLEESNQAMEVLRVKLDQMSIMAEKASPSDAEMEKIAALEARLEEQQSSIAAWVERSNTIATRYTEGMLNEAEAAFAHSLITRTQAFQEGEVAARTNDIRRRDHTINTLRSKLNILESEITRLLQAERTAKALAAAESRSFILSKDVDAPSQNDDSTLTIRSQVTSAPQVALPPIQQPSHLPHNASPIKKETFRTNFARIDLDSFDNIIDDDDGSPPPPKLGKRDRMSPSKEDQTNLRRNRPRRAASSKPEVQQVEPAAPPQKPKYRKRK